MQVLLAWIGNADLAAVEGSLDKGVGPIAQALNTGWFTDAVFLDDHPQGRTAAWQAWVQGGSTTTIAVRAAPLSGPTEFGEIYLAATSAIAAVRAQHGPDAQLAFHLSPGTPAMAAVWLLLAKSRYAARLIESSRQHGVRVVNAPFDIAADFLPDLLRDADARLARQVSAHPPLLARFGDILYRGAAMATVVARARKVAVRTVPVLILGETGTGKELLARAIHHAGPRKKGPFVALNCGAIPAELVESELFGHQRGAFTGAVADRPGAFEQASGGTLLLDEVGELPLAIQVKLLRVLQDQEIRRLGDVRARRVDVRIIAATHRDLITDIATARFREDLYYRLAVAVLRLPALRARREDLPMLVDHLWTQVQAEAAEDPYGTHKTISVGARNLLVAYAWPGNVRQLINTLRRAAIWCDGDVVSANDIAAELPLETSTQRSEGDTLLGDGFSVEHALSQLARSYLTRAMAEAGGNKTRAAKLLGLASYQTLNNWLKKYDISASTPGSAGVGTDFAEPRRGR